MMIAREVALSPGTSRTLSGTRALLSSPVLFLPAKISSPARGATRAVCISGASTSCSRGLEEPVCGVSGLSADPHSGQQTYGLLPRAARSPSATRLASPSASICYLTATAQLLTSSRYSVDEIDLRLFLALLDFCSPCAASQHLGEHERVNWLERVRLA